MTDVAYQSAPLKNLDHASQYDLREMKLILSGNAQAIDLRNLYTEFNIYEDMLGTTISGNITIVDSLNLLASVGFSGNERLHLVVDTATKGQPIDAEFLVYGMSPVITNSGQNSKRSLMYVLNFCSEEKLRDLQTLVTKSYRSTQISKIVADIMGSSYINTKKNVTIEETSGNQDLIIPSFRPMKAIDWLSTRAISTTNNPDYVFFENRIGYYFMSLETLFTNVPSTIPQFIVDPKGINNESSGMPDIARRMKTVKDFEIIGSPDLLQQTSSGVFASVLNTYDPVRLLFKSTPFSIIEGFAGMKGTGGAVGTPPYLPNYDGASAQSASRYFYPTNYGRTKTPYGQNDPSDNNTLVENFMGKRQSLLSGMQTFKVRIMIAGNLGLTIGSIIDLAFPSFDRKTIADIASQNDVYSGKYLATALRHQFTITEHNTFVECVKSSPAKPMGRT